MSDKIKVGISRCLLGDAVRYDGQSKPCAAIKKLADHFELIPICPEVEAGLTIPRPPVQLTGGIEQLRLIGRDDPSIDITELMRDYCQKKIPNLDQLCGFIAKSRSPSCGWNSAPVFNDEGKPTTETASGIFTQSLISHNQHLPIIEETQLELTDALNEFIQSVSLYKEQHFPSI